MSHLTKPQVLQEIDRIEREMCTGWGDLADVQRRVIAAREAQLPKSWWRRLVRRIEEATAAALSAAKT